MLSDKSCCYGHPLMLHINELSSEISSHHIVVLFEYVEMLFLQRGTL